jgi:hypothetical protein
MLIFIPALAAQPGTVVVTEEDSEDSGDEMLGREAAPDEASGNYIACYFVSLSPLTDLRGLSSNLESLLPEF